MIITYNVIEHCALAGFDYNLDVNTLLQYRLTFLDNTGSIVRWCLLCSAAWMIICCLVWKCSQLSPLTTTSPLCYGERKSSCSPNTLPSKGDNLASAKYCILQLSP